jgi:hypothetical protein
MTDMRSWTRQTRLLAVLIAATTAAACGDVVRQGRGPMFLVIDSLTATRGGAAASQPQNVLLSDVITNVTAPPPCATDRPCPTIFNDGGTVTFRLSPKDVGTVGVGTTPSTNNQVTITRYRIVYRRADGRNTPGVDVPYGFDGAATVTVPATGAVDMTFELVRHQSKREAPLVSLSSSPVIITTLADVTFYGRDQVGNDISATGSIQIDFGNFGDQ